MATIKELVQKEAESFEKAQKLKAGIEKMATYNKAVSEISKEVKKVP